MSEPTSIVPPVERPTAAGNLGLPLVSLPARLLGGTAIQITRQGLGATVSLDIGKLEPQSGLDPAETWVACWTESGHHFRVPINIIPQDVPIDGIIYGRRDGAWVDLAESLIVDWDNVADKPATFPPTLPIPQSGVTDLVTDLLALKNNIADIPTSEAGVDNTLFMSSLGTKASVLANARLGLLTDMLPFPGYVARDILGKLGDWVNVRDFGAAMNGTTDDTDALNDALASARVVELPEGTAYLTDAVVVKKGQTLVGKGRSKTFIKVDTGFNMAALGVIRFEAGEPGANIRDIGMSAVQPAAPASRADIVQYPPAIYMQGCPRSRVTGVRFEQFYNTIDARGNCGGSNFDDLEIGGYGTDIWMDGSLDSVRITRVHHWPFGGIAANAQQRAVYSDSDHYGLRLGRVDDLQIDNWIGFSIPNAMYFYLGLDGAGAFAAVSNSDFDDRGGLVVANAGPRVRLTGCFFSMGKTDARYLTQAGGSLIFSGCRFEQPATGNLLSMFSVDQGSSVFTGCTFGVGLADVPLFDRPTPTNPYDILVSGCIVSMGSPTQVYTTPTFNLAGARGIVSDIYVANARTTGARGLLANSRTDGAFMAANLNLNGWTVGTVDLSALQLRTPGAAIVTSGGTVRGTSEAASTAAPAGRGVFRFATGTGAQTDEALLIGVEDAVNAWLQGAKPGAGYRNITLQPVGASVTVGPITAPIHPDGATTTTVSIAGRTTHGRVELSTSGADVNGLAVGDILFSDKNSSLAEKRRIIVRGSLKGTTANARGGRLQVLAAGDNSTTLTAVIDLAPDAVIFGSAATTIGFFGTAGTAKPTISGSRAGNAALADLLTKLAAMGLITDGTTA